MCQPTVSRLQSALSFTLTLAAIALVTAAHALSAQPEGSKQSASTREPTPPPRGAIYVDVETDGTGAVARLVFLNKVAPEIQEYIRKKTLGRHFGEPYHTYRRHLEYNLTGTDFLHSDSGINGYQSPASGSAVDVKGKRHTAQEYAGHRAPWNFSDRTAAATPDYPTADRAGHHQGRGYFRIVIDPATGAPRQVTALKSTGYASLDDCAIAAFRRFRWKPNTWKEVDVAMNFEIESRAVTTPPPNTVRLPQ